ncbi:MAG TPA: response regulator [Mycobacteriales bacterium]|nr:response regulator [Mycobacteriales bacterium]
MTVASDVEPEALIRALVVDDAEDLRLLITQVLLVAGYDAVAVGSGPEALEALRRAGPGGVDVVVLDVQMPLVDGWEVLERIRAEPSVFGRPAVLMCTVRNSAVDRERAERLGADGYLSKPFAIADLAEKVARLTRPEP